MDKEDVVQAYSGILLSCKKKNEIMPFAAMWLDLEIIILNEVSKKDIYHMIPLICEILENNTNLFIKQKQTHTLRKQIYDYQKGKAREGIN